MSEQREARKVVKLPLSRAEARSLRAGELLSLHGVMYTARDAAHARIVKTVEQGGVFPVPIQDLAIYYAGPCPAPPGATIGSVGPTTSGRMDAFAPQLIEWGQTVMVGKGLRKPGVIQAMREYGAVYLGATGGVGALLSKCVLSSEVVAFPDLGAEAVRRLEIADFPAIVLIDSEGASLYNR